MKRLLVALLLVSSAVVGCKKGGGDQANGAAAKEVLVAFTKPGADYAALTNALRPKPEDYDAVFVGDAGQKVKAALEPVWEGGKAVLKPGADQSEITISGATPAQLAKGEGNAAACPGGYKDIADKINPKMVVYCARFAKAGEKLGLTVDGMIYVNGHWALFPKSFKALK